MSLMLGGAFATRIPVQWTQCRERNSRTTGETGRVSVKADSNRCTLSQGAESTALRGTR
jgi:hypothetical protein